MNALIPITIGYKNDFGIITHERQYAFKQKNNN